MDIDTKALERLVKLGGEDLLGKMLELFSALMPGRLDTVRKSWESRDWKSLEHAAHSIKSSAGNVGAVSLYKTAAGLERDACENNAGLREEDIDTLFKNFEDAKKFLEDYRKKL